MATRLTSYNRRNIRNKFIYGVERPDFESILFKVQQDYFFNKAPDYVKKTLEDPEYSNYFGRNQKFVYSYNLRTNIYFWPSENDVPEELKTLMADIVRQKEEESVKFGTLIRETEIQLDSCYSVEAVVKKFPKYTKAIQDLGLLTPPTPA